MHQGKNLLAQGHTSRQLPSTCYRLFLVWGFLSHSSVFLGVIAEQGCARVVEGEDCNLKTIKSMEVRKNTGCHVSWMELGWFEINRVLRSSHQCLMVAAGLEHCCCK